MIHYHALEWDEEKRLSNLAKHGVDFALAEMLDWETLPAFEDSRRDYGETRFLSYPKIAGRMHTIVFFAKRPGSIRVIGMRKANKREIVRYG